uniref:Centromere protein S n=1 Tax=Esox lucius TaxID=8010 RepID=A0A6Q2WUN8_ESOLU
MSTNMDEEERQLQRLKAAVHHTVGRLCQSLGENHQMEFSRQVIAAISETTFRQWITRFEIKCFAAYTVTEIYYCVFSNRFMRMPRH